MTAVYAQPTAVAPVLGGVGVPEDDDDRQRLVLRVRAASAVPAVITVGVHWIFLITYWIPETSAFPAHDWWLTQLSPLVAESVTSAGHGQVPAQAQLAGAFGELLLVCALALLLLARHPRRLGQSAVLVPAALGTAVSVVLLLVVVVGGHARSSGVSILLLVAWVAAAAYASVFSLLLDLGGTRPRRWSNGVPLLAVYAVIGPAPVAVGRALFGPELRDVAATLEQNTVALRLSALTTPSTLLLYLAGLLLGVAVWAAYQCWPVRRDLGMLVRIAVFVAAVALTGVVGDAAGRSAHDRATQLRQTSPAGSIHRGCGASALASPDGVDAGPVHTVAVTGLHCRSVTTFAGYRQLGTHTVDFSLFPVTARSPDGRKLAGRPVGAQYGDVLVLVGTSRLDTGADRIAAFRVSDAELLWQFSCTDRPALRVRFARVPGGDDAARGHVTARERRAQVVGLCGATTVRFDPATGLIPPS